MKIRSKALYEYLLQSDILHGTDEDIAQAKQQYRKIYKRQWKQRRRPRKEIRIDFTLKDFQAIRSKALASGTSSTKYARTIILSSLALQRLIPHKQTLLKVLQLISIAVIASSKNIPSWQLFEQLAEAEEILLKYLKGN